MYGMLGVPKGRYVLSCYDYNKDGHEGNNRWRDYLLTVKVIPKTQAISVFPALPSQAFEREQEAAFDVASGGATMRVRNFSGGVWKRFYMDVTADAYVMVKVARNHSFNTILPGIFLDPVGELCGPQGPIKEPAQSRKAKLKDISAQSNISDVSLLLMDRLLVLRDANPAWYVIHSREFLLPLVRRLLNKIAPDSCLAAQIEEKNKYVGLRPDIAACLRDVQMFDLKDRVYFSPDHYATWAWLRLTQQAVQYNYDLTKYISLCLWDDDKYNGFIQQQQSKQTW